MRLGALALLVVCGAASVALSFLLLGVAPRWSAASRSASSAPSATTCSTPNWTPVLILLLLIGLLAFRPTGLSGRQVAAGSEDVPPPVPPTVATRALPGSRWLLGSLLALGLLYPWTMESVGPARLYDAASALLLVTLAVGLSVVVGFAGLLDLGYATFFALGGYTAGC